MPESWYEEVGPEAPITQGDLILACPLVGWDGRGIRKPSTKTLKRHVEVFAADVVVMTQACDLEYRKVPNVVLCPNRVISDYKAKWEVAMQAKQHNATAKAWSQHCGRLAEGSIWNLAILDKSLTTNTSTEHRVVDFHEIFTTPRDFIESLLEDRGLPRLRLRSPYREHLSQAFARFFMRVGLPTSIDPAW